MSSIDPYSNYSQPPSGPYKNALEVVGDDDTDLPVIPGALIVNYDYYVTRTRMTMQNGRNRDHASAARRHPSRSSNSNSQRE